MEVIAMETDYITKLEKIDEISTKYDDLMGSFVDGVRGSCGITPATRMREEMDAIAEEGRLLSIGIVGRVKAGKSSLLNSLFFEGKEYLPKAATPMTAALTVIRYAEKPSAEVEFFTKTDMLSIQKEHDDFISLRDKLIKERTEQETNRKKGAPIDQAKIARIIDRELDNNPKKGSWEQYELMKKSSAFNSFYGASFQEKNVIATDSIEDLKGKLDDYVGANGKYMPFTRDVILNMPIESLKDIQIVDTPGLNDPVKSREKRTEDYLGQCDVVFLISPSGAFLSQEDLNLMGLVSLKKGISKIYIAASRSDSELFGDVKVKSSGILDNAISMIRDDLSRQALGVLRNKTELNPESKEIYDPLVENLDSRLIFTSSVSHAILRNFEKQSEWDEDMKHTWSLLKENYQDWFSSDEAAKENLLKLSGVSKLQDAINEVRQIKDEIIKKRQEEASNRQKTNIDNYLDLLLKTIHENENRLRETDAAHLKARKEAKERIKASASINVDDAFDESIYRFKMDLGDTLRQNGRGLFDNVGDFSSYEKEEVKTKKVKCERVTSRVLNIVTFGLCGKETYYDTETYTVRTIQTAPIKRKLESLVQSLQEELESSAEKAVMEWRGLVQSKTISALREAYGDNDDDIDITLLKTSIRKVIGNMQIPEFSLSAPTALSQYTGILKNSSVDEFLDAVNEYEYSLRNSYSSQIKSFLKEMEDKAKKEKMSDLLFSSIDAELEELEKQISSKEATLERFKSCISELSSI